MHWKTYIAFSSKFYPFLLLVHFWYSQMGKVKNECVTRTPTFPPWPTDRHAGDVGGDKFRHKQLNRQSQLLKPDSADCVALNLFHFYFFGYILNYFLIIIVFSPLESRFAPEQAVLSEMRFRQITPVSQQPSWRTLPTAAARSGVKLCLISSSFPSWK